MEGPVHNPIRRANIRRERLTILGVVVLLLGAVALPQAFRKNTPPPLPDDGPPLKPSQVGEMRGMTLQLHSYWEGIPFEQYVGEIARTGANTVCFSLAAYQENASSSSIFIDYRKVPSVKRMKKLIKVAHDKSLSVVMMPIVLLENPRSGEWRGKINPTNKEKWWKSYNEYILFYARIAADADAEVFIIGSELVSMEGENVRWRNLIRDVRKVYKGRLSYSAIGTTTIKSSGGATWTLLE